MHILQQIFQDSKALLHIILILGGLLGGMLTVSAQNTLSQAQKALKTGRYHQAINYATDIRENTHLTKNNQIEAWLISARAHNQLNQLSDGLRCYLRALSLLRKGDDEQHLSKIYTEIGKVYLEAKMNEKALEYFIQAQLVTNKSPELFLTLPEYIGDAHFQFDKAEHYVEALELYNEILQEYRNDRDTTVILRLLRKIVNCQENLEDYGEAITQEEVILRIYSTQNDTMGLALSFNNLGYYNQHLRRYETALRYFEQSRMIHRKYHVKNYDEMATLVNMGVVHQNLGDYQKSLAYMLKGLKIAESKKDLVQVAQMCDLISAIYFYIGDYHNARIYNELAIAKAQESQNKVALRDSYRTASEIASGLEDYKTAMNYTKLYLALRDSLLVEQRWEQQKLTQLQYLIEQTEKKTELLLADQELKDLAYQQALTEAEKQKQELELLKEREARTVADQKRQKSENEQTRLALELARRQLEADRRNREITELEKQKVQQQLELKQKELEEEKKNEEIEDLEQTRQFLEREQHLQEKTIQEQRAKQHMLYGILGLGILILFIGAWSYRKIKKQTKKLEVQKQELVGKNNEIETQNEELQQQQEEIIAQRDNLEKTNNQLSTSKSNLNKAYEDIRSSVQYAERIQTAMLPTLLSIRTTFPESFILYKPRDIVSGDFYWFGMVEGRAIFTAADCTGHGVPGAFMSLIGNDLLNEIIMARHITAPDQILNELHQGVVKSLKQDQNQIRDGMDIALCSVDLKNHILEFAGAKNPLIYIKNGKLQKVRGDKMPIGGSEKEGKRIFKRHEFSINSQAEHTFYMFSDGYQDQFGGPKGKKFMSKRFRELLFDIHQKPMPKQQEILDRTITDWMGEKEEQIDDILVIGFKIWG